MFKNNPHIRSVFCCHIWAENSRRLFMVIVNFCNVFLWIGFWKWFYQYLFISKWSWITQTNQRVWAGVIATILYTIPVVLGFDYVVFIVLNGVDPSDFFKGTVFLGTFVLHYSFLWVFLHFTCQRFYDQMESCNDARINQTDISLLQKGKGQVVKLSEEVDDLRDNISFLLKI